MANLIITEFVGIHNPDGQITQAPSAPPLASQAVEIAGANDQSSALNAQTTLICLHAEAECSVAIGDDPDAEADAIIPLTAGEKYHCNVPLGSGYLVGVVSRTVS